MDFLEMVRTIEGPPPEAGSSADVLAPYFDSFVAFCRQTELDDAQALEIAREAERDAIAGGDWRQEVHAMYVRLRLEMQCRGGVLA